MCVRTRRYIDQPVSVFEAVNMFLRENGAGDGIDWIVPY